jgi:DNA polymerase IV
VEPEELWHPATEKPAPATASGRSLPARYYLDLQGLPLSESLPVVKEIGQTVRRETHLAPAIGLAADRFTAEIAATVTRPNHIRPVAPDENAEFLSPQSLHFLPLAKETARRLRLLGIRTLGQLAKLPLPALREQFGPEIEPLYRQAKGQAQEVIRPKPEEPGETVRYVFDNPLNNHVGLSAVLQRMATTLAQRLQSAGLCGQSLYLSLETEDSDTQEGQLTLRHPTAQAETLGRAFQEIIASFTFASGITSLTIHISSLKPAVGRQLTLLEETAVPYQAWQTVQNLAAKYGITRLYQASLAEPSHPVPEYRIRFEPFPMPVL